MICKRNDLIKVKEDIERISSTLDKKMTIESAKILFIPTTYDQDIDEESQQQLQSLLDKLDDMEDVQQGS